MPISFAQIPQEIKVPLYWVEVDPSKAGLPTIRQPALLVGSMLSTGTAPPNQPIAIGTQAQADDRFGQGSELANMFKSFFHNQFSGEVWGAGVPETSLGAGTLQAASGTIVVTAPPTAAGTIHLYVAGEHIPINCGPSDTIDAIAAFIAEAINDDLNLPVSATVATATVTVTCLWKGITGNDISLMLNYFGAIGGQEGPQGLVLTMPATGYLTGGNGVPDWNPGPPPADPTVIDNMGEQEFEYVALAWTDTETLQAWDLEYGFTDNGRWGWRRQLFGHIFTAKRGLYSDLITWGLNPAMGRNSGVISTMAVETKSPTPVYEWAAAYTAKAQRALINDPARPLQTLSLTAVKPAPLHDRFSFVELNSLAGSGFAIQKAGSDGYPMIAREQTTYQWNLYGQGDDAYELVTTLASLAKLLRNQRHAITTKFPRHKLANDGTRFGPGQAIVTPGIIKGELIAQYRQDEYNGLVEDTRNFKRHLLVERDPNNPNRVNVLYPPDLINQLRIFAVLAQFRLQYDRGIDVEIIGPLTSTAITGRL
jgi:phage tail sheath gpL-like